MRNFQTLDQVTIDDNTGIIYMRMAGQSSMLVMQREGEYIAISASHGPFEIALRPRFQELKRVLSRLRPVAGLQTTTRQIGTAQAYLAAGLSSDGTLIVRPTIVADATGHLSFNLTLTNTVRSALFKWLTIDDTAKQ